MEKTSVTRRQRSQVVRGDKNRVSDLITTVTGCLAFSSVSEDAPRFASGSNSFSRPLLLLLFERWGTPTVDGQVLLFQTAYR